MRRENIKEAALMTGRIAVQKYLPYLSVLTKQGAAKAEDVQAIVKECMTLKALTKADIIERLYSLDVNEEKFSIFSSIISSIESLEEENNHGYYNNREELLER